MSRDSILRSVRSALGERSEAAARQRAAEQRLGGSVAHQLPQAALLTEDARLARFKERLRALGVEVTEVARADVPVAIAAYLSAMRLPLQVRCGSDAFLAALPWASAPGLERDIGPAEASDAVGLSRAVAGVAETGTLALASGPDNPVTLGFLPDTHIVVLGARAIVGSYEEACRKVMARAGGALPRTLNFITGASRTGDIGGQLVMGAHGPRRLAVLLVADEA